MRARHVCRESVPPSRVLRDFLLHIRVHEVQSVKHGRVAVVRTLVRVVVFILLNLSV